MPEVIMKYAMPHSLNVADVRSRGVNTGGKRIGDELLVPWKQVRVIALWGLKAKETSIRYTVVFIIFKCFNSSVITYNQ